VESALRDIQLELKIQMVVPAVPAVAVAVIILAAV
jgi:hypothetical protein